jgi:hypothetical protein
MLLTLTLSIAVFMAVQVTNESIGVTADHQMNFYQSDVEVDAATSDNPLSAGQFISSIQSLPNVTRVEAIDEESVTIAARQLSVIGLPAIRTSTILDSFRGTG